MEKHFNILVRQIRIMGNLKCRLVAPMGERSESVQAERGNCLWLLRLSSKIHGKFTFSINLALSPICSEAKLKVLLKQETVDVIPFKGIANERSS